MPKRPMTKSNGNGTIGFSIKELLVEINRKIDDLSLSTRQKADRTQVDTLSGVVLEIQRKGSDVAQDALQQVEQLKQSVASYAEVNDVKNKVSKLERDAASEVAVKENNSKIEYQAKQTKWQWIAIGGTILVGLGKELLHYYLGK